MMFDKKIYYLSDSANWVIKEIGESLKNNLNKHGFTIASNPLLCIRGVRHYATRYGIKRLYWKNPFVSNVVTYFHGDDSDLEILKVLRKKLPYIAKVHTSCRLTEEHLLRNGVPKEKIVIVPIGIDVNDFTAVTKEEKLKIREELGIPTDAIVIGSFQKDGNGWGEGNTPKLCKGPDLFCEAIRKLNNKIPVYVLLSGPSRGFVKTQLTRNKVPFKHKFLENYKDIGRLYNALDLYLVSSRLEGGPRAPMEAQACGIPVVSTRVGQVEDVILDGVNGLVVDVGSVDQMVDACLSVISDKELSERLVLNGLETVKEFDYSSISQVYMDKIYKDLL